MSGGEWYLDTLYCVINTIYDIGYYIEINSIHGIVVKSISFSDAGIIDTLIGGILQEVPFGYTDFETLNIYTNNAAATNVFPNPASDGIKISINTQSNLFYSIYNIFGQLV